jgi:hypothetical protein
VGCVSVEVQKVLQERSVETDCLDWQFNLFQVSCWWMKHIIETWDCETFKRIAQLRLSFEHELFAQHFFPIVLHWLFCVLMFPCATCILKVDKWVAKTIGKATIPFVLVKLMVCVGWQMGCQILEGNEWSIFDGLHSNLSFIGIFCQKEI